MKDKITKIFASILSVVEPMFFAFAFFSKSSWALNLANFIISIGLLFSGVFFLIYALGSIVVFFIPKSVIMDVNNQGFLESLEGFKQKSMLKSLNLVAMIVIAFLFASTGNYFIGGAILATELMMILGKKLALLCGDELSVKG
jgi:hypothetical protein